VAPELSLLGAREKSGELVECELFGARIGWQRTGGERVRDADIGKNGAKVIAQRLALHTEANLYKFQEAVFVGDAEVCALAWESHAQQRGCDARRRAKGSRRNPQSDFGFAVKLAGGRQIAVGAATGMRGDADGDFELDNDVDGIDTIGEPKEVVEDR
jgi:hypothetical protein